MLNILLEALRDTVLITGLVMVMMLLIEYVNINSHGSAFKKLKSSSLKQVLVGTFLGLVPGCIGGFAAVSLYTHRMLSFGALIAMMIASTGDESFIMMAMIPRTAVILFIILFAIAIVTGLIVDRFSKKDLAPFEQETHFKLHDHCCGIHNHDNQPANSDGNSAAESQGNDREQTKYKNITYNNETHLHCSCESDHSHDDLRDEGGIFSKSIFSNFKKLSKERLFIMVGIAMFITAIVLGILEHSHDAHGGHSRASHSHELVITDTHHGHTDETDSHSDETHTHADGTILAEPAHSHGETHNHSGETHSHSGAHNTTTVENLEHSHAHNEHLHFDIFSERWLNLLFALVSLVTLFLTAKATEHFIKEHLWNHVIKSHLLKIFLWTLGALTAIHFGLQYLDLESWMSQNVYLIIVLAAIIGLIPESGPHMIFIAFFANGMVPFSVLLTSSIVQDGHTTLPLLAESKMSFVKAKLIKLVIGLTIGITVHLISTTLF